MPWLPPATANGELLTMAALNLAVAQGVYKTYRHVCRGGSYDDDSFNLLLNNRGLIAGELKPQGWLWKRMNDLNNNFGLLGYGIIGIFAAAWIISFIVYRIKKLDEFELAEPAKMPQKPS